MVKLYKFKAHIYIFFKYHWYKDDLFYKKKKVS